MRLHSTRLWGFLATLSVTALLVLLVGPGASVGSRRVTTAARSACARHFPRVIRDGFPEPPMRFSRNGKLDTTLRASVSPVTIAGRRFVTMNYEGSFPGPTLVFCPSDNVVVHLISKLHEVTNLHVHRLHVSPRANHDNVFSPFIPHGT
jgi:FtsP/CotA-like multicopper oxidase with cupredoxin domain